MSEEQRNLVQQQAQTKAQMLRYEDELARKRMQVGVIISNFLGLRVYSSQFKGLG